MELCGQLATTFKSEPDLNDLVNPLFLLGIRTSRTLRLKLSRFYVSTQTLSEVALQFKSVKYFRKKSMFFKTGYLIGK